jgi:hypothetical protein
LEIPFVARNAKTSPVESAGEAVVSWLRAEHRQPQFFKDVPEDAFGESIEKIVEAFLRFATACGFSLTLVNNGSAQHPEWAGHWTHRGYSFEGFRQPPGHHDPMSARLLACAALLRNEWCCARLM